MRYSPERQYERESVFDDTIEDFFLLPAPSLSNRPLHLPDLMGSGQEDFLRKQIGSFLSGGRTQEDLFKEGINNANLPSISTPESDNDLDLTTEECSALGLCAKGVLLDPLKQEGKHSDEKDLSGNLIENLLPSLIRLLDLMPRTDNPLDFALKSISSNRESEGNLDSSLSRAPKRRDFLNGPGSHLFSSNIQDKFNIKLNLHNGLKEFNWGKQFDGIGNARHKNPNTDLVQSNGTSIAGIEDVTYSDFENKRIKDMLADTAKFETQVDMNDFILKTCGFKSLLARGEESSSDETLLDAVKLASRIKSGRQVQDNEEAVSVVYDLFKGDQRRLASIINKTDQSNSNSCMLDNKPSNEFGNNECLSGDLVKNKINGALASFSRNVDSNEGPDANSISSVSFKDNVQLLTDQIRELLICVNSLDLEKNIIQPLSDAFLNMENAINNLTDSLKVSAQENRLGSNIHDYKAGSESSRMP